MGLLERLARMAGFYQEEDSNMLKPLYGQQAINKVEDMEGELTPEQRRVVELEGYNEGAYDDTKGIKTSGVGQTGEYMGMSFKDAFKAHEDLTSNYIPNYKDLPTNVRGELVQLAYRGDLQQSPTFRKLFNEGRYQEASEELLNHDEYKAEDTPKHIKERLEDASRIVADFGKAIELEDALDFDFDIDNMSLSEYKVKEGDTLYSIAKQAGKTVAEVVDENRIKDPTRLQVGQVILL